MSQVFATTRRLLQRAMALGACLLACAAVRGGEPALPAADPHRDPAACSVCHGAADAARAAIPIAKAEALCVSCHDGRRAARERHPVGRTMDPSRMDDPRWPLREGRVGCLTCHDMRPGCTGDLNDQTNHAFLRGDAQHLPDARPFCTNCHRESAYRKTNPHLMLKATASGTEIVSSQCLFCHQRVLDRNTLVRSADPQLRGEVALLCHDCHQQHRDGIAEKHVGATVAPEMQARSVVREAIGLGSRIPLALLSEVQAQRRTSSLVHLDGSGRMSCMTCHNPHQAGVFPGRSELSYRAMVLKQDGQLASPVRNAAWCRYCHEF